MSRLLRILLCLTLGLTLVSLYGCPDDDDDSAAADDDDVADDDDAVPPEELDESEPNDAHPFQDLGTLDAGRYAISGAAATAGHEAEDPLFLTGDLDVFSFQVANGGTVGFELDWVGVEDLDMVLFEGLTDASELNWATDDVINAATSEDQPETMSHALVTGTVYTVLLGNWEGTDGAEYVLTLDIP